MNNPDFRWLEQMRPPKAKRNWSDSVIYVSGVVTGAGVVGLFLMAADRLGYLVNAVCR